MKKSSLTLVSTLTVAGFLAACQSQAPAQAPAPEGHKQPAEQGESDQNSHLKHDDACGEGACGSDDKKGTGTATTTGTSENVSTNAGEATCGDGVCA